ncbi:MAG TPA: hypothetical protein VMY37_37400 [Thermoguttaceae bacterium]|nr:hypothetical protein [Thermoguttaceae bacterium]
MHDIDFLPSECRQKDDRHRWYVRRVLVATGVVAMIAALAWSQERQSGRLAAELAAREPARAAAAETKDALGELQSQLQLAQASANLVTYLRHPWPRTRILAAILGPLPNEITFEKLYINRGESAGRKPAERRSRAGKEADQEPTDRPPAVRDLEKLREELDSGQTIVTITGVTTESAVLHQYLGALGRDALFSKSQLQSIEADTDDPARIRFSATLVVRPGYGQPDGPSGPKPQLPAPSDPKTT